MAGKHKDLIKVIASRATAYDGWAFMQYLPNPDPVLKRMGRDIRAYRELLSDSHVGGCVRRRKAAVKALEWRISPSGNARADAVLEALFARLPLQEIMTQILDAALYGYQALEVVWGAQDGLWLPQSVTGKPQEWFVFNQDNRLCLRTKDAYHGRPVPEKKFLLATQQADYMNPYGRADLALCFWAATFKKGGFKFWLEFIEKYGAPWLIGKHPRTASPHEIEDLLDSMEAMLGTAVAAIPEDSSISIEEAGGKGASSAAFDDFLRYCKSEIAIALLGQNQTTEAEANRASASAGLQVAEEIRNDDARLVEGAFNQLLAWICELNFAVDTLPRFELFEQEAVDTATVERDVRLAQLGLRFSKGYLMRTYGFEAGDFTLVDSAAAVQTREFAEPAPGTRKNAAAFLREPPAAHPADALIERLDFETKDSTEQWLEAVRGRLLQSESLEDFRSRLDSLIPELDYAEYAELLALSSAVAELAGRQSVEEERRG